MPACKGAEWSAGRCLVLTPENARVVTSARCLCRQPSAIRWVPWQELVSNGDLVVHESCASSATWLPANAPPRQAAARRRQRTSARTRGRPPAPAGARPGPGPPRQARSPGRPRRAARPRAGRHRRQRPRRGWWRCAERRSGAAGAQGGQSARAGRSVTRALPCAVGVAGVCRRKRQGAQVAWLRPDGHCAVRVCASKRHAAGSALQPPATHAGWAGGTAMGEEVPAAPRGARCTSGWKR